jgi:Tfp pilus assembly ATPase PilU
MISNSRVQELIRESRTDEIIEAIEDGDYYDMQSFAKSLIALVVNGDVDRETAANAATNRHDFLVSLDRAERDMRAIARERDAAAGGDSTSPHGLRMAG